jgi:hypothetical protein
VTTEKYESLIAALESWAAEIVAAYEGAEDMEGADDLQRVVRICTADMRRNIEGREGGLQDLAELKKAIRLAELLIHDVEQAEASRLKGWRYGAKPANIVQAVYQRIMDMVMHMTSSVIEIERRFLGMAAEFNAERRAYRASLEQVINQN